MVFRLISKADVEACNVDLFWSKVDKTGDCWLWRGGKDKKGYGRVWLYDHQQRRWRKVIAHRLSFALAHGGLRSKKCILHNCPTGDNSSCVNPDHLWSGTVADNNADMIRKGRAFVLPPLLGESNPAAIFTEQDVRRIKQMLRDGMSCSDVAECFKRPKQRIYNIQAGRSWRHIA